MTDKKVEEQKGLSVLSQNEALAKMYQDNAQLGAENLGGISPLLKVHTQGRSTTNQLSDGNDPNDGYFFYKPTGEQFKEVECHILTISKGFRADGINKKDVFNQVMAGVIVNGGKPRPFIMYVTGLKLSRMWEFGKEASKYTHAKPVSIPMFALKVKLTTEQVKTDYGKSWVVKFEVLKSGDQPIIVADMKVFTYLKAQVSMMKDVVGAIIDARSPEEAVDKATEEVETLTGEDNTESVALKDIPF